MFEGDKHIAFFFSPAEFRLQRIDITNVQVHVFVALGGKNRKILNGKKEKVELKLDFLTIKECTT